MATSGNYVYNVNRNVVIEQGYSYASLRDHSEELTAAQVADASIILNNICKELQTYGHHLWVYRDIVVFPILGRKRYVLGQNGDRSCYQTDFVETTLSVAAVTGATSVTLTSVTDIAVADNIGFVTLANDIVWRAVSSIVGNVVTLSAAVAADYAVDTVIYSYTNTIAKPMEITILNLEESGNETPLLKLSQTDYTETTNKSESNLPTQFYYKPVINTVELYIVPTFSSGDRVLKGTIQLGIENLDTAADDLAFPNEWNRPLSLLLARDLGIKNGIDETTYQRIKSEASEALANVLTFDNEDSSVYFYPDMTGRFY